MLALTRVAPPGSKRRLGKPNTFALSSPRGRPPSALGVHPLHFAQANPGSISPGRLLRRSFPVLFRVTVTRSIGQQRAGITVQTGPRTSRHERMMEIQYCSPVRHRKRGIPAVLQPLLEKSRSGVERNALAASLNSRPRPLQPDGRVWFFANF